MTTEAIPITSRDQWLALREQDVTASDVAAIAGVSPYKTALRVWAEKTGEINESADTNLMRRGRWLEDGVIAAVREERPHWLIVKPGVYLRDPERRIGATPDAYVQEPGVQGSRVLQCKVISKPVFEASWEDGVPLAYQLQVLTEMMLAECDRGWLAALVIDTFSADLHIYPIERHAKAEARIQHAVAQFWADAEAGRRPGADLARDGELLSQLFLPDKRKEFIDLSGDNLLQSILEERAGLNAAVATAEARLEEIKADIIQKLGGAPGAIVNDWKISNKMTHRSEYVVRAKSFPTLRVSRPKEKKAHG